MDFSKNTSASMNNNMVLEKKHSTNHALINIRDEIRDVLNNNYTAIGVYVDFQKAFDTAKHSILVSKLDHYDIRCCINDWY